MSKKIKTWDNFLIVTVENEPPLILGDIEYMIGECAVGDFLNVN